MSAKRAGQRIGAAQAGIIFQHCRIAARKPQPPRLAQRVDQRANVAQSEVHALPRKRMNDMRGLTDQREARAGKGFGDLRFERLVGARPCQRQMLERTDQRSRGDI